MPTTHTCDVAIVGGGLSGSLIALALAKARPDCDVRLVEASGRIGGNHLWSFFATDVSAADRWIVAPLISYGWKGYDVRFPAHSRTLNNGYYSIESARLDQVVRERLPERALMLRRKVLGASARALVLDDGDRIEAGGVIDCRGPGGLDHLDLGWQKFVGQELLFEGEHHLARPVVMDATIEQIDGYRFLYALPFSATRLFVEDTYYSDTADLDLEPLRHRTADADPAMPRIQAYAERMGWRIDRVARSEVGVLPVAMGGNFEEYWRSGGNRVAKGGLRAGLFHPLTGYSLPDAVRLASAVAKAGDLSGPALHELTHGMARKCWRARGFYRMLAAMLFKAADPQERYRILERFYRLDPRLIARFYAGQSSALDRMRVLSGKPPVPVGRALRAIGGKRG